MSTIYAPAIHDLFSGSFSALLPEATDIDRPRLIRRLRGGDGFRESKIIPYTHRPFDTRWMYVESRWRPEGATYIGVCGDAPLVTHLAAAEIDGPIELFPLTRANLTAEALDFVHRRGVAESDLFYHAIAMLAARRDMRIPLGDDIRPSALLGYRFASLFDEHDPLVLMSQQAQALRAFGVPARIGKEARMLRGAVLRVDAGEHVVTRICQGEELAAIAALGGDEALALLGPQTCDVYLNERALWRNVPLEVWRYAHRGVPLLRAWLRDRSAEALGRGLLRKEVTHFSAAVRRIVQLLLLQPALAKNAEM